MLTRMCMPLQDGMQLLGRLTFPLSMFAYPFYLMNRSPGKEGSHYDPKTDLFSELEGPMVRMLLLLIVPTSYIRGRSCCPVVYDQVVYEQRNAFVTLIVCCFPLVWFVLYCINSGRAGAD